MNHDPIKNKLPETGARVYRLERPIRHSAPGIEILFVLEGAARLETVNMTRRLAEPDILLLSRCETIRISPEGKDCLLLVLRAAPNFLSFSFGGGIPVFECDSAAPGSPGCALIRSILAEAACYGMAGSGGENALLVNSALLRLLHELKRNFSVSEDENREMERERMINAYIKKNYRYPLTLEELADKLSLTPQYLSRYFRKQFGVNFHAYLNSFRLENAVKDLVLSDATVTAIAYDNGFPNLSSFLKKLKDSTGQTPTEYRKSHGIKEPESEKDIIPVDIEEKEESALVLKKLRPYIKTDNSVFESDAFFQKKLILAEADARTGAYYGRPWEDAVNLGFARDFTKAAFFEQINLLQNEIPFRYGRFQGLFGKSTLMSRDKGEGSFVQIDRIINFLYEVKLIPFVELSFKPDQIAGKRGKYVFYNSEEVWDISLDEYEELVGRFMKRMVNRYGLREINRWRFEMMITYWNLFDYAKSDLDAYIEQFVRIRKIIKDIAPSALVGGPGFNLARPEYLDVMGKILDNLEKRDSLPDFFSFYAYSFSPVSAADEDEKNSLIWEKRETAKRIAWAKEFIQSINPAVTKFFVTEWNMDYSCRNRLHDSLIKAPFILQNCIDAIGTTDALSYWLASDISAEYNDSGAILFGGPGLLSRHGIRKPSFYAYRFLSMLGPVLLAKGEGYIITAKSENSYAAIVFNYKYISNQSRLRNDFLEPERYPREFLEDTESLTVNLRINGTEPGRYKITQHVLNTGSGSVYDTWKRLDSVDELSNSETSWLEHTCVPALQIDFIFDVEGSILLSCELEANESRFLEINRIQE